MDETYLYRKIADSIRLQILHAELHPGESLPSIRAMATQWGCTLGTVQRAYQELAHQGLVTSRPGRGTRVVDQTPLRTDAALHKASLVHRAESFLLEVLTAGYMPDEVEHAFQLALERWRVVESQTASPTAQTLRFAGSHDLAVTWLAGHFNQIFPGHTLQVRFSGSLGGLTALQENQVDLAGCHLWDEQTDGYNLPDVQRLMPGKRMALVTLAYRHLGLILPSGNPDQVTSLQDLMRPGLRFVNRQPGSGTRVWLDANLRTLGIPVQMIEGYSEERATHSEVARAIADGTAQAGIGLEAAAYAFELDFIMLTRERYDLVMTEATYQLPVIQKLVAWLVGESKNTFANLVGYDLTESGKVTLIG